MPLLSAEGFQPGHGDLELVHEQVFKLPQELLPQLMKRLENPEYELSDDAKRIMLKLGIVDPQGNIACPENVRMVMNILSRDTCHSK